MLRMAEASAMLGLATMLAWGAGAAEGGLVAHFGLDESAGSGNPVANSAGSIDGQLINAARVTQGVTPAPFGTAYDFAPGGGQGGGVNTQVNAATKPTDDFTISFWFRPDTLDQFDRLVESMDGTVPTSKGIRFDLGGAGNRLRALLRDGSGSTTSKEHSETLTSGAWYFGAVRFDKESDLAVTLIPQGTAVDATEIGSRTEIQGASVGPLRYDHARPSVLGVEQPSGPLNNALDGRMDDVGFFNHVLSDAELAAVYNAGVGSQARSALLGFNAADAPVGDEWLPRLGSGFDWNFLGPNDPSQETVATAHPGITHAYRYTGNENVLFSRGDDDSAASNSFGDSNMGLGDGGSASFELWFKPTDLVDDHVLWETGGNNGASLTLNDDTLRFGTSGGTSSPDPSAVTHLLGSGDIADFLQVIGVIDQESNETRMYVNGLLAGTPVPNATNDWSGINASGLGVVGENATGGYTGNPSGHTTYVGDIAIFNFYQYALGDAEALSAFLSVAGPGAFVIPEPSTLLIWALLAGLGFVAGWRRRNR